METGKLTRIIREMKQTHSTDKSIESKLKVWISELEDAKIEHMEEKTALMNTATAIIDKATEQEKRLLMSIEKSLRNS